MNIAVVGLGLIGGSIAKAVRSRTGHTVYGHDIQEPVLCKAELLQAIDARLTEETLSTCDFVFLALYPEGIVKWLSDHAPRVKKGALVLDTGGVKQMICSPCEKIAAEHGFDFEPAAIAEITAVDRQCADRIARSDRAARLIDGGADRADTLQAAADDLHRPA